MPKPDNLQAPPSTKRAPVPPPIPARHHPNGDPTTVNNAQGKSRKQTEQPPELPPKTGRAIAAAVKLVSPTNPVTPVANAHPIQNKENHQAVTPESEPAQLSQETNLVQRPRTKSTRRRMTEEEAIKELGSFPRALGQLA